VRDLAGDVRFMRQELSRWVRRFVPLKPQSRSQDAGVDREFLEGRIDAVVDELGLRIREIHETLSATLFEQLVIFDPALTRQRLFRRDLENVLDIGQLLDVLANLFDRVKEFDEGRRADQLQRVKTLLRDFRPEQFLRSPVSGSRTRRCSCARSKRFWLTSRPWAAPAPRRARIRSRSFSCSPATSSRA
jgi:hypothetical protein